MDKSKIQRDADELEHTIQKFVKHLEAASLPVTRRLLERALSCHEHSDGQLEAPNSVDSIQQCVARHREIGEDFTEHLQEEVAELRRSIQYCQSRCFRRFFHEGAVVSQNRNSKWNERGVREGEREREGGFSTVDRATTTQREGTGKETDNGDLQGRLDDCSSDCMESFKAQVGQTRSRLDAFIRETFSALSVTQATATKAPVLTSTNSLRDETVSKATPTPPDDFMRRDTATSPASVNKVSVFPFPPSDQKCFASKSQTESGRPP
uniref:Uncharacterized protein n=1 Tax=Chromera velia CCMP2878 TaxID=1169474 RepID=A0A0G4I2P5_9ALVE|eukprot:Cvel_1713.t1-p1 / transcript=Cvel_1713.t1 / gene=Cvel_1713 / organism=Chromera_velia_CCMP2878 / gene_product=hypothetical protein / transcript_product=hypothetical protein / location=Cvel_scaffold62:23907-26352(-) / protein_length=265 / sequence_SO=supercontig / SO=protein_coding / is_pseudo=false